MELPILGTIKALLGAVTAFLKVWPLLKLAGLEKEYEEITWEIGKLALDATPANQLRINWLKQKRERISEFIRAVRSAIDYPN